MIRIVVALIIGAAIAVPVVQAQAPSIPKRVVKLERQVKALQGQVIQLQKTDQNVAEADDRQQRQIDVTRAAVACLTSWVGSVSDQNACNLLNLPSTPPNYAGLVSALRDAASG